MKDLINKISSYNLFNYLFPGAIYVVIIKQWSSITLLHENLILSGFLIYFIGLVISRFGSLIIEPILKETGFIKFAKYSDFIKVEKDDNKLEILSEANNTYRTLTSLFVLVLCSKSYLLISKHFGWTESTNIWIATLCLLIMFVFSYRQQTAYITKRIKANLK